MRYLYIIVVAMLVLGGCKSEDEPVGAVSEPIDVRFNFTTATIEQVPSSSRSEIMRDPLYENVIKSLFVMQYDPDGILMYVSPKLQVFYGSETAITDHVESGMYSTSNSTVYVMVNFTEEQYRSIKTAANLKQLAAMKISLNAFKEQGSEQDTDDDDEIKSYMRMLGEYSGIVNNALPLNITLGRYMARVSVRLKKDESNTSTYRNVRIGFINSPRQVDVLQAMSDASYTPLTAEDLFSLEEMTDGTPIAKLDNTSYTDDNTRYFYLGENLSTIESGMQTKIHIEAERDGESVSAEFTLTSSGLINRNTNYEFRINLTGE